MLLGGLWHGAGWNFVIWGAMHGVYLMVNHVWRAVAPRGFGLAGAVAAWLVTFIAVVFAWVPFRATSFQGAESIWKGMLGLNGIVLPERVRPYIEPMGEWLERTGVTFGSPSIPLFNGAIWISIAFVVAIGFPNTQQLLARYRPAFETYKGEIKRMRIRSFEWRPTVISLFLVFFAFIFSLSRMSSVSEFLYFNF